MSAVPSQSMSGQSAQHTQSLTRAQVLAKTLLVKPGVSALLAHAAPAVNPDAVFAGTAYLSDSGTNEVYKISAKGKIKPVGSGWSEPQGIGVDPVKGDVYVADTANSRIVELSKTGKPVSVLNDPGQYPAGASVTPDGTVGVTNIISTSGGAGSVSVYAAGATSPSCTTSGLFSEAYFLAADSQDNFYADGFDSSSGAIILAEISKTCAITPLQITQSIEFPGGVQIIDSGKGKKALEELLWGDQSGLAIYAFNLASLAPLFTVSLGGGSDEVEFALTKNQKIVGSGDAGTAALEIWPWPAGGQPIDIVTGFSLPIGIGFTPSGDE